MSFFTCLCLLFGITLAFDPSPNPKSIVTVGHARFTVLTSRLIRMEWGSTVNAATFTFIHRNLPTPNYKVTKNNDGWSVIDTNDIQVSYNNNYEDFKVYLTTRFTINQMMLDLTQTISIFNTKLEMKSINGLHNLLFMIMSMEIYWVPSE